MKKILIIADRDLGNSGVPAVIMSIVRGLHLNYVFDIVLFEESESVYDQEFSSYGGKIILFNIKKPKSLIGKIYYYLFGYRKQVFKELSSKININDYCAIHSFKGIFSAPFLEYGKKHAIEKRILHINGIYNKNPKNYLEFINKINKRKCLKFASIRLAVSNEAGVSFFGGIEFKCVLNPINDKFYKKLPPYYEKLSLTQIGTYSDRKNQLFTIEVFRTIKQFYRDAVLNFLGYEVDTGYINQIKLLANKYNLLDSIKFFDQSYNQIQLLKETSVCLFPSKSEAFGLVAVENQACNRPVICSTNILKEVDCGGAVFLDYDPEVWAREIISIFSNKKQFNIDVSRFNNENYCSLIECIYKEI